MEGGSAGSTVIFNSEETIKRLSQTVTDMIRMLRAQQQLVAQRGIQLSSTPLQQLELFGQDVIEVGKTLNRGQTELGQLRELARTIHVVNSLLDIDQVLSDVIDTVITLIGAERGYIMLRNKATGALEFRIARNLQQSDIDQVDFTVSRTVVERVAKEGMPIFTVNAQADERFSAVESIADYKMRSILCVPLKFQNQVIGVIYTDNRLHQGVFAEREERLVSAFAGQAAIAIENARLFDQVRANIAERTAIKEFMDNIFASIGSGVIATDHTDQVTVINDSAAEILALDAQKGVGRSLWSVLPRLYDGFEQMLHDVRDQAKEQTVDVEPILPSRGQISLTMRLSPFRDAESQRAQGVAIVMEDITARKQQEAQLSVLRRYLSPAMVDNIQAIDNLQLGGVERMIGIIYCDIRGFSTFSEKLPPEGLMEIINKYLATASDAIFAHQGVIDKYMGDAVVGLFNTQLNPQTDQALRAVRAAQDLVTNVRRLQNTFGTSSRLAFGVGVHLGMAVLGNVGSPSRKEFTAIGESLEVAKLLQENAADDEIILSAEAYQALGQTFKATSMAPRKQQEGIQLGTVFRLPMP
jgi:adenylate cyclase